MLSLVVRLGQSDPRGRLAQLAQLALPERLVLAVRPELLVPLDRFLLFLAPRVRQGLPARLARRGPQARSPDLPGLQVLFPVLRELIVPSLVLQAQQGQLALPAQFPVQLARLGRRDRQEALEQHQR